MNEQLLKDLVATAQHYNYDWDTVSSKFPELKEIDTQVLKDYVASAEHYGYDYDVVNSKFPEFGLGKTTDPASDMDSGSESGLLGSVQDRTAQPSVVVPEIDANAPLSSEDFYSILSEEEEEEKEKVDDKKDYTIPEAFKLTQEAKDKDTEALEAWLNEEYFGKGVANQAMGTDNITAYQINDPTLGDLKQDFKSNLGELGISRTAFENLSDSDLDEIFTNVFSAQVRIAQAKEGEKDERIKVNDILLKKEKDQTDSEAIETN